MADRKREKKKTLQLTKYKETLLSKGKAEVSRLHIYKTYCIAPTLMFSPSSFLFFFFFLRILNIFNTHRERGEGFPPLLGALIAPALNTSNKPRILIL